MIIVFTMHIFYFWLIVYVQITIGPAMCTTNYSLSKYLAEVPLLNLEYISYRSDDLSFVMVPDFKDIYEFFF